MLIIKKIFALAKILRYRFFLFAGIFPFILGQTLAYRNFSSEFSFLYFLLGLIGVFFVLGGVETFNEYFDSKMGTDRIFSFEEDRIPDAVFFIGIICFVCAGGVGIYLTYLRGWPIIIFSVIGFFAAAFYVAPPFRWAYRGLGELVIAFSYGPLLVCGSYYLQTQRLDKTVIIFSILSGLLIFPLSIINEIPDYYQDKIVGKRNLVVRFGKKNSILLYSIIYIIFYIILGYGVHVKSIPLLGLIAFLAVPMIFLSIKTAIFNYDKPQIFVKAIRETIFIYLFGMILLML